MSYTLSIDRNQKESSIVGGSFFIDKTKRVKQMIESGIFMSLIEIVVGITIEGIILAFVFQWIASKETDKQHNQLKQEMNNLEKQNRFDFEQLMKAIQTNKTELISQIKESEKKGGK